MTMSPIGPRPHVTPVTPRQALPYDALGSDAESLKTANPRTPRVHARGAHARADL